MGKVKVKSVKREEHDERRLSKVHKRITCVKKESGPLLLCIY